MASPAVSLPAPAKRGRSRSLVPYMYMTPMLIFVFLFTLLPAIYTVYIAFTNYSLFNFTDYRFVGLDNFIEIFSEGSAFAPVLGWTIMWTVVTSFLNIAAGVALALLLNHPRLTERNIYRALLIIPWALPFILSVQMWGGLFNYEGVYNQILGLFGIEPVRWLQATWAARTAVLVLNMWLSYPYFMTIGLAALTSIPRDMYEAADIDGATTWDKLRKITLPFMLAALMPLVVVQLAQQFNNFGVIYLLTSGNPLAYPGADYGTTDTLVTYSYKLIFNLKRYGLAAAYGIIIFFVVAALTLVNSRLTNAFKEVD
jgi:arabinogalactan oligomer / maltooligosaccharide transport system permease protein